MKPIIGITCSDNIVEGEPVFGTRMANQLAIEAAGGIPILLSPTDPHSVPKLLKGVDGVVVTGSDDIHPREYGQAVASYPPASGKRRKGKRLWMTDRRFRFESAIFRYARDRKLPVLGICGGMQLMNIMWGGTLYQDVSLAGVRASRHVQGRHAVRLLKGSRLAKWIGRRTLSVRTVHHQAVDRLGAGLRVTALAPDGVIEAIEYTGACPQIGVEWHPEYDWQQSSHLRLFKRFVALTGNRRLW